LNLIVFRQYLDSDKSFSDLKRIKRIFKENEQFRLNTIVIAQVGKKAEERGLITYRKRGELPEKGKINTYHLSTEKAGLTLPISFAIDLGKRVDADKLVISDSDFQFGIKEIFTCLTNFNTENKAVYLPKRKGRQLDITNYKLNRYVIEDLENSFVYYNYSIKQKLDFQSGLVILNKALLKELIYLPSGKWAGNIDLIKDVLDCSGELISGKEIETLPQNESSISYDVQLLKFKELEKKFNCSLKDVLIYSIKNFQLN